MRTGRRAPAVRWWLLVLAGAGAVAVTVGTVVRPATGSHSTAQVAVYLAVELVAALVCLLSTAADRRVRTAWRAAGVGLLLATAADGWYAAFLAGREDVPYPSVADWLYFAWCGCQFLTVLLLLRARVRRLPASNALDGLVAGLGAAALAAAAVASVLTATGGRPVVVLVNLAYPLVDVALLLLVAAGIGALGPRLGRPLSVLAAATAVYAIGDVTFLLLDSAGRYVEGSPVDATWPVAAVLTALAATLPDPPPVPDPRSSLGRGALAFPIGVAVAALGLLVFGQAATLHPLAGVLAAACVLAALTRTVVTFHELTELAETRRQARTDDLTGLTNRRGFLERLAGALAGPRPVDPVSVLLLDLNRFKEINDALGHDAGDELLRQIAPRLTAGLRAQDEVARLGGDEFAVLLAAPSDRRKAEVVARGLHENLTAPFLLGDVWLHVEASIGISLAPEHGRTSSEVLRSADVAMYEAKGRGGGYVVYSPDRDRHDRRRLETVEQLRRALEVGQLVPHYQPQVRLSDGTLHGVEALARWQHPTRGLLPPDDFLALAEQSGLLGRVTEVVLDRALADAAAWRSQGHPVRVAVNLSPRALLDPDLDALLAAALRRHGVPPGTLAVEITETALIADPARAKVVAHQLRASGYRVAIDDYGTGYSSLAYLRQLAVDELKLDRLFVRDLGRDPQAYAIVRSTIDLAHSLGLGVVAEGVESAVELQLLDELGCDAAQGFLLGRPMGAAELSRWLSQRPRRRAVASPQEPGGPLATTRG